MDQAKIMRYIDLIKENCGFDVIGIAKATEFEPPFLVWEYVTGSQNTKFRNIVLSPGIGIAGKAFEASGPIVVNDVDKEIPEYEQVYYPICISEELKSLIAVSFSYENIFSGVFMGAYRDSCRITKTVYEKFFDYLEGFEGLNFAYTPFDQAVKLEGRHKREQVPIYEIISYQNKRTLAKERQRFSMEIHDGVLQDILAVQMLLRSTKYQKNAEEKSQMIDNAVSWLNDIMTNLRGIATNLYPASLQNCGLEVMISSLCSQMEQIHGIPIHLKIDVGEMHLMKGFEIEIYRICQEALGNACKYSKADQINVDIKSEKSALTMLVKDNGVGFDYNRVKMISTELGLRGMLERAAMIGGIIDIKSEIGVGTQVTLKVHYAGRELNEAGTCR